MMAGMADWGRLASIVTARRVELGLRTREQFAIAAGMSVRLLASIENAERPSYDRATLVRLEQALGWQPGSADAVLTGGQPTLIPGTAGTVDDEIHEMSLILASSLPDAQKQAIIGWVRELFERQRAERRAEVERWIRLAEQLRDDNGPE